MQDGCGKVWKKLVWVGYIFISGYSYFWSRRWYEFGAQLWLCNWVQCSRSSTAWFVCSGPSWSSI